MSSHPYKALADKAFWSRSVARHKASDVDPVGVFELRIDPTTKVATAGSCFAQHIARHLKKSGFCYYVAEEGHPILPASVRTRNNYGLFSARYGNIYTARQLLQLFQRAYGEFQPSDDVWVERDGRVLDPFRPSVQPGGFVSVAEMRKDREQHLAAVRTMFETLEVFVFTLGLTECWRSVADGAVYPLAPGVEGGSFSPERYEFYNQTCPEVVEDLKTFRDALARLNPHAQIVLTVSPVPLAATGEPGDHVLSATTYSKSVLRVAAETVRRETNNVHYFPSFEIITGSFNRGSYYAADLRNVLESGVNHVMRLFMSHVSGGHNFAKATRKKVTSGDAHLSEAERLVEVECDEVALDR